MNKSGSIESYFKTCSYLLMGMGFATLVLTGRVDLLSILLYIAALALSWHSDRMGSRMQISSKTANWLALSFIPFIYFDWRFISGSYTGPLIHYSLFISIFNLFKVKADRDWVFLYLIAVFEVLLAATLTIDFTFIVLLSAFILVALATLEAFEIKRSRGEVYEPKEERFLNRLGRMLPMRRIGYLVGVTFVMVLLIGLLAAPIFLLIPRFNSGFMAQSFGSTMVSITGFSDVVELGDVGSIKKNEQVVMHVRLKALAEGTRMIPPKWRGVALSQYDGHTWREPRKEQIVLRSVGGRYQLGQRSAESAQLVEENFYLEPLNTPVVFLANRPIAVNDQLPMLYRSQSGTLTTNDHSFKQITYTAYSDLSRPSEAQLRRDERPYSEEIKNRYLQLPELDERVAELAKTITLNATTRLEKAEAIEKYLIKNYGYTLELRRTTEPDPLVDFLFNVRAGHCEYFASSMVVLLRSVGVAARIVNGFQTGEYNEVGDVYVVRQSDAHSWVEVYFPESDRWVEFDPTPPAGFSRYASGFASNLRKYMDALRMLWLDYVVTYDSQRQSYLAGSIQQAIFRYKFKLDRFQVNLRQRLLATYSSLATGKTMAEHAGGLIGLIALLGGAFFFWQLRRLVRKWHVSPASVYSSWLGRLFVLPWLRWRTRANPQESAVLFYNEMLAVLSHWGIRKMPEQTPLEFAVETGISEVRLITDCYNVVRFSGRELAPSQWEEISGLLAQLRKRRPGNELAGQVFSASRRRYLAWTSLVVLLPVTASVAFYFYNERCFDYAATAALAHITRFELKADSQKVLAATNSQARVEPGNGGEDLIAAFTAEQSAEELFSNVESTIRWRTPWDDYFDPSSISEHDYLQLQNLFEKPGIQLLERAAARSEFHLSDLPDLSEPQHLFVEQLSHDIGSNYVNLMLWKAYLFMRGGKSRECERELKLIVSLGDRLSKDSSFTNVLLGYLILARGSRSIAKYCRLIEQPDQTTTWLALSRDIYRQWAQMSYLYDQIHITGASDAHMESLLKLAEKSEPAVAQEVVAAIGKDWLANPNHILFGMPESRRILLENLTRSSDMAIAQNATRYLLVSTKMSLSERTESFRETYFRQYLARLKYHLGLGN